MAIRSALLRLFGREVASRDDVGNAVFRRVVEHSADVICRIVDGRFCYVSPSAQVMFGLDPQLLVGTDGLDIVYPEDRPIILATIGRLASGEQSRAVNQVRVICGDGSIKWIETTAQIEKSDLASEVILVMRDVTDRKLLEEELAALALQDGLTGLANRRSFDQALDREWRLTLRNGDAMALVLIDIDYFKQFNDLYGHQAGDDCLRAVAGCIRDCARRPRDLACRYGGEELVVILGGTSLDAAVVLAEEMRAGVAALQIPHQGSVCADHITISIGVAAAISRAGGTMQMPESLLLAADHALYKAKAGGRDCVEQSMLIAPLEP